MKSGVFVLKAANAHLTHLLVRAHVEFRKFPVFLEHKDAHPGYAKITAAAMNVSIIISQIQD